MSPTKSVTLMVRIAGQDAGASRAVRGARTEVAGLGKELQNTKVQIGSMFATYVGYEKLEQTAQAASSLIEAQNTAGQVFGSSLDQVRAFGQGAAESIGLSERAALQATNQYASLLKNAGLTEEEAAQASMTLTALSSDIAAFRDKPVEDALAALRSGIVGEMEPLRNFSINLSDAKLRAEALNQGIYDGTGILTAQQKAYASLAVIQRESADAQGQYAREADGLAQVQQRSNAQAEDAQAAFGEGLLPIFKAVASTVGAVAEAYNSLPGPAQAAVSGTAALGVGLAGLSVMAGTVWPAITTGVGLLGRLGTASRDLAIDLILPDSALNGLGSTQQATTASSNRLTTAFRAQSAAARGLQGGLLAGAAGLSAYHAAYQALEELSDPNVDMSKLEKSLRDVAGGGVELDKALERDLASLERLASNIKVIERNSVWEKLSTPGMDPIRVTNMKEQLAALDEAMANLVTSGNAEEAAATYQQLVAALVDRGLYVEEVVRYFDRYHEAQERAGEATSELTPEIEENTESVEDQKSAYERALEALEAYQKRTRDRVDTARALTDAERSTREAQDELADALRAAAGDSEEYRDAREGIVDAEQGVRDAQEQVTDAQRDAADAQRELNEERVEARQRLVDMAQAARDAALAEADATLKVKEARNELDRVRRNRQSSPLERERAELEVRQAEEDARKAAEDAKRASTDNADAQRRGVEGDAGVVQARKRVEDANRRVADAERGVAAAREAVSEAERRAAAVIATARERVAGAVRAVESAMFDEAEAAGDAATAQFGAARGAQEHARRLREVRDLISPDSDLRRWLDDYITALEKAGLRDLGSRVASGSISLAAAEQEIIAGRGNSVPAPTVNNVTNNSVTLINQGTPAQQLRNQRNTTRDELDRIARGTR